MAAICCYQLLKVYEKPFCVSTRFCHFLLKNGTIYDTNNGTWHTLWHKDVVNVLVDKKSWCLIMKSIYALFIIFPDIWLQKLVKWLFFRKLCFKYPIGESPYVKGAEGCIKSRTTYSSINTPIRITVTMKERINGELG